MTFSSDQRDAVRPWGPDTVERYELIDQDPREIPASQHEPFERRLLILLRRVVAETGLRNDLTNLGLDANDIWGSFTKEANTLEEELREEGVAIQPGELTKPFYEPLHPFLLGLCVGVRIRWSSGFSHSRMSGEGAASSSSTLELIEVPLRHGMAPIYSALHEVFDDLKLDYYVVNDEGPKEAGLREPIGFTQTGFEVLRNCVAPYALFNPRNPLNTPPPDIDTRLIMHILLKAGVGLGAELRRLDRVSYRTSSYRTRRPRGFFLTHGNDRGQTNSQTDTYAKYRATRSHGQTSIYEATEGSNDIVANTARLSDHVAALSTQGAREFTLWHLFSNMLVGDFVLFSLRPFDAKLDSEVVLQCSNYPDLPCGSESKYHEVPDWCARHRADQFVNKPTFFPGYVVSSPPNIYSSRGAKTLWALGLVTKAPEWIDAASSRRATAWQGNIGFLRPFPQTLNHDPSSLSPPLPKYEREMAYLQFDSGPSDTDTWQFHGNVSFDGEQWHTLLERLSELMLMDEGEQEVDYSDEEAERARWDDDVGRLQICSENLAVGSSIESLALVAPDFYFPEPWTLTDAAEVLQENSRIWILALNERGPGFTRSKLDELPGVVSEWNKGHFRREKMAECAGDGEGVPPVLFRPGVHERNSIYHLIRERKKGLANGSDHSFGLAVASRSDIEAFVNVLGTRRPGTEQATEWNGRPLTDDSAPDLLILPFDPAWTMRRPVWRFFTDKGQSLYLALVSSAVASMEATILHSILEARHNPEVDKEFLESALGMPPGAPTRRPLGVDDRTLTADNLTADPDVIKASVEAFLRTSWTS